LGQGRFESIEEPVGGIEEIQSLQRTLVEMARQLRASRDAIRRYVGALTGAQEEERRRLARELHDQTVQSLIALDQHAQIALMALRPGSPDATARLTELRQLTAGLLDELRRVIRGLRPIYLEDLGLLAALEILAGETQTATGTPVVIETVGVPLRLAPEREIAVFRIAQEALSNVERHAQAGHVDLKVEFRPGHFLLTIGDDGRGFAVPPALADLAAADHYGLLGMHERAELIGASLDLRSSPDAGTTVTLDVPL
jgi:signal transduction histidine kinase